MSFTLKYAIKSLYYFVCDSRDNEPKQTNTTYCCSILELRPLKVTISTGCFGIPRRRVQSNKPERMAKTKRFLLKYERVYLVLHRFSELLTLFRDQSPLCVNCSDKCTQIFNFVFTYILTGYIIQCANEELAATY